MNNIKKNAKAGLTLIELLIVVTILAILALLILVSLDPLRQFAEARNDRRWSHVQSLSTAIYRYIVDNDALPGGITTTEKQIGTATTGCNTICTNASASCLDMTDSLKRYLLTMPVDPSGGSLARTHYSVVKNDDNIITVKACNAENGDTVQMSR